MKLNVIAELRDWCSRLYAEHQARAEARARRPVPSGGTWLVHHGFQSDRQPYVRPRRATHPAEVAPTLRGSRRPFRLTRAMRRDSDVAESERTRRDRRHRMRMARLRGSP